jgi:hypothetical protein
MGRTPEWSYRAAEELISINVSCSPVPERETTMMAAAMERCAGMDVGKGFWLSVGWWGR